MNNCECIIRRMTLEDVDAISAIENATFPTPWPKESFIHELEKNPAARYFVAEKNGVVIGFAGSWIIIDEAEITNVAISADERGHGCGRRLMTYAMQYLANLGASYVTLEVRKSNETAQNLYKSLGFFKVGVRKQYYEDNREDALLMLCDKMPPADPDFEEPETVHE